ncbi:MAG: hypothetical protein R3F59_25180 [Myxococcota bacterium]
MARMASSSRETVTASAAALVVTRSSVRPGTTSVKWLLADWTVTPEIWTTASSAAALSVNTGTSPPVSAEVSMVKALASPLSEPWTTSW